jgi:hypothetical protein
LGFIPLAVLCCLSNLRSFDLYRRERLPVTIALLAAGLCCLAVLTEIKHSSATCSPRELPLPLEFRPGDVVAGCLESDPCAQCTPGFVWMQENGAIELYEGFVGSDSAHLRWAANTQQKKANSNFVMLYVEKGLRLRNSWRAIKRVANVDVPEEFRNVLASSHLRSSPYSIL